MGIQDLGAIGEFVSSIAVLITLAYLAVQVRHSKSLLEENRRLAQSQVFQTRAGFRIDSHMRYAEPHMAALLVKVGYDPQARNVEEAMNNFNRLDPVEQQQYRQGQMANVQLCENAVYQAELGLLDQRQASFTVEWVGSQYPLWQALGINSPRIPAFVEQHGSKKSPDASGDD